MVIDWLFRDHGIGGSGNCDSDDTLHPRQDFVVELLAYLLSLIDEDTEHFPVADLG